MNVVRSAPAPPPDNIPSKYSYYVEMDNTDLFMMPIIWEDILNGVTYLNDITLTKNI